MLKAYSMIPLMLYEDAKRELQAYLKQEPKGDNAEQAQRLLARLPSAHATTLAATR
jgi:hypothetical protein